MSEGGKLAVFSAIGAIIRIGVGYLVLGYVGPSRICFRWIGRFYHWIYLPLFHDLRGMKIPKL